MSEIYKLSINLSKIPRERISTHEGKKYIHTDIYIGDEPDKYGNYGSCSVWMGEGEDKVYLGNLKPIKKKKEAVDDLPPIREQDDLPF